jgi:hypothetical protein
MLIKVLTITDDLPLAPPTHVTMIEPPPAPSRTKALSLVAVPPFAPV